MNEFGSGCQRFMEIMIEGAAQVSVWPFFGAPGGRTF